MLQPVSARYGNPFLGTSQLGCARIYCLATEGQALLGVLESLHLIASNAVNVLSQ